MQLEVPAKKYGAILIDPPWPFDTYVKKDVVSARGEQPYATMQLSDIAGLPLQRLMAKDCAIFLWQVDFLPEAAHHLAWAWGRPGSPLRLARDNVVIWRKVAKSDPAKVHYGLGKWARGGAETVAVLVKGRPALKKAAAQFIDAPRREHSRKPDEIYGVIENLVAGPYLEMFARQQWPSWDQWGDETTKFTPETKFRKDQHSG